MLTLVCWRYNWRGAVKAFFFSSTFSPGGPTRTTELHSAYPRQVVGTTGTFICPAYDWAYMTRKVI